MLAPSVDENGDVTTPAREAMAALEKLIEGRDPGVVLRDHGIIYKFCSDIEIQINAAHAAAQSATAEARTHFQRVMALEGERQELTGILHECKRELVALVTSARAVCNCLERLDPTELRQELSAPEMALNEKRIRQIEHLMQYSVFSLQLDRILRRMFFKLNARPKLTDAAIKWVFEQLKRSEKPWWTLKVQ